MKKPRLAEVWQGAVNHQYVVLRLCQHNQCKRQINREGEKENRAEWTQENYPARRTIWI